MVPESDTFGLTPAKSLVQIANARLEDGRSLETWLGQFCPTEIEFR